MKLPNAIISLPVEPKNKADLNKFGRVLRKLLDEGLSFRVKFDQETSQTIISAMSELQLESIVNRIKYENDFDCNFGHPEVIYREGITKKVTGVIGKYEQQAQVIIDIEPGESGTGLVFINNIKDDLISQEFINSIKEGIEFGAQNGVLSGYSVSDFIVTLVAGSCHDVNAEAAFQLGKNAITEALLKAGPVYQEPMMKLEISVPEDYWGVVTSDLMKRRGQIKETGNQDKLKLALVDVPLAEMIGYAKVLSLLTKGRASFSMEFSFYADIQNKLDEGTSGMVGKISPKFPPHLDGKAERNFEE